MLRGRSPAKSQRGRKKGLAEITLRHEKSLDKRGKVLDTREVFAPQQGKERGTGHKSWSRSLLENSTQ